MLGIDSDECAQTDGRRDCAAAARRDGGARPRNGAAPSGPARRHCGAVSIPREPPRIRGGTGAPRHSVIRLQGTRVLRRGRNQGRAGADPVSGRSGVGSARGGVDAVATVRCCRTTRFDGSRRIWPAHSSPSHSFGARRPSTRRMRRRLDGGAGVHGAMARPRWTAYGPAELLDRILSGIGVCVRVARRPASSRRART